jgi:hypothetical protein
MDDLPTDLLAALPETGVPLARQWWGSLAEADRERIALAASAEQQIRLQKAADKRGQVISLGCIGLLIGLGLAFGIGWFWGGYTQAHRDAERQYQQDCELFAPVLAADPAFHRLIKVNFPVAGYCLDGSVRTQADFDRLQNEVARIFGVPRIGHVLANVWIEEAAVPAAAPGRGG